MPDGFCNPDKERSLGCHVRTATIVIGVFHLVVNTCVLGYLIYVYTNLSDLTLVINSEGEVELHDESYLKTYLPVIITLITIAIIIYILLIFGAVKSKPMFLIPYLIMQFLAIAGGIVGFALFMSGIIKKGGYPVGIVSTTQVYFTITVLKCYNYFRRSNAQPSIPYQRC